jgi:hypothetical protein
MPSDGTLGSSRRLRCWSRSRTRASQLQCVPRISVSRVPRPEHWSQPQRTAPAWIKSQLLHAHGCSTPCQLQHRRRYLGAHDPSTARRTHKQDHQWQGSPLVRQVWTSGQVGLLARHRGSSRTWERRPSRGTERKPRPRRRPLCLARSAPHKSLVALPTLHSGRRGGLHRRRLHVRRHRTRRPLAGGPSMVNDCTDDLAHRLGRDALPSALASGSSPEVLSSTATVDEPKLPPPRPTSLRQHP